MRLALFAIAVTAAVMAATPADADRTTPYQPAAQSSRHVGYSEAQVDVNRVRVTFRGTSGASRESVETNLLYRAAELTLQQGFDYFVVADHSVDVDVSVERYGPPAPPIAPRRYDTETRFIATSDILMFRGLRPLNAAAAFDARAVQSNLSSHITRPR